jgi:hypothetical protein
MSPRKDGVPHKCNAIARKPAAAGALLQTSTCALLALLSVLAYEMTDLARLDAILLNNIVDCERLEAEIEVSRRILDHHVRRARAARNVLAGVSRLPDEVLCLILRLLGPDSGYGYNGYYLVASTHVCRRWRRLALGMPSLWVEPVLNNTTQMKEWITRAKSLPIRLYWIQAPGYDREEELEEKQLQSLQYALYHANTRQLYVEGEHDVLLSIIVETAPRFISQHLEHLHIGLNPGGGEEDHYLLPIGGAGNILHVPHKLTHLDLHNSHIPSDSAVFIHLVSLDMTFDGWGVVSFLDFIEILRNAPLLECLRTKRVIDEGTWVPPDEVGPEAYKQLELHHLHTIDFSDSLGALAILLRFMRAPDLRKIFSEEVISRDDEATVQDTPAWLNAMYAHADRTGWGAFGEVALSIGVHPWANEFSIRTSTADASARIETSVGDSAYGEEWLHNIIHTMRWEGVTSLSLSFYGAEQELRHRGPWTDLFTRLPCLSTLVCSGPGRGAFRILKALVSLDPTTTLPDLATLNLKNSDLAYAGATFGPTLQNARMGTIDRTLWLLVLYATQRSGVGRPLKELQLNSCGMGTMPLSTVGELPAAMAPLPLPPPLMAIISVIPSGRHNAHYMPWQPDHLL